MTTPVLSVEDLTTVLHLAGGPAPVVRNVSFDILPGETVALVGESGCGKSMTMLSVMGLHPSPPAEIVTGRVMLEGVDLVGMSEEKRRLKRGADLAMVYQDPMTSLNPLMRVGDQISEVLVAHGRSHKEAHRRTEEVLGQVGIPRPARAANSYPHEFSGGMRQRVVIAIALALRPKVLIADEPTTALDVTIQQQIIDLVRAIQADTGMAVVWITHDLGVVARVAGRMLVMYGGHIVESGVTAHVFSHPEHPYTSGLLKAIPPIRGKDRPPLLQIPGTPPDPGSQPPGCPFNPRCPQVIDRCTEEMPPETIRSGRQTGDEQSHTAACWVPPSEWA